MNEWHNAPGFQGLLWWLLCGHHGLYLEKKLCVHFRQLEEDLVCHLWWKKIAKAHITNVYADFVSSFQKKKKAMHTQFQVNMLNIWTKLFPYLNWTSRKKDHLGPWSGFEKCQVSLLGLEFAVTVRFFSRANLFNLIKIMWLHPSIILHYINRDAVSEESCLPCSCLISHQAERL